MEMTNNLKAFNRTLVEVLNLEQSELPSNSKEYQVDFFSDFDFNLMCLLI